ncbi:alpha/beta hydrolase [Bacillus sp. 165]|uniref:alpha/beta hydrolase n=1 Tax=Bacillus sp. 165 TaxID=1529117 RepID=UPI001ADB3722|nr:alpha/beta hydrolase [Bacillus sp. 165]MBO9128350.1 alpha/beta hydrolase [Bacillus sp. 165]
MKNILKILTGIGTVLAALVGVGMFFTNKIMYIKKKTEEEIIKNELNRKLFHPKEFEAAEKEEVWIDSGFGYKIHGYYFTGINADKYIIISHGVTVNKVNSVKYGNLFLKRGFNVLIYDHRRHGLTGGKTTSFGYYEKYDLKAVVDWMKSRFGADIILGIHGESMGAATLLEYAGTVEDGASFYIADCPYSDFYEQLASRLKVEFHLPKWPILPIADMVLKLRDGYSIKDVSPIKSIRNIHNPILFIHSKPDDYITYKMTEQLYEEKKGPKQLYLAERGLHALSYVENQEEYENAIDKFLKVYA